MAGDEAVFNDNITSSRYSSEPGCGLVSPSAAHSLGRGFIAEPPSGWLCVLTHRDSRAPSVTRGLTLKWKNKENVKRLSVPGCGNAIGWDVALGRLVV